jgi:hypothetical protein
MAITYDEISFIILLFGLLCLFIKKKKQIPGLRNIKIMALIVFIYNLSSAFMGLLTEAMWFSPDFSKLAPTFTAVCSLQAVIICHHSSDL